MSDPLFKSTTGSAQELKCPQCGNPKSAPIKGSLTSWIFQPTICDCPAVSPGKQAELPAAAAAVNVNLGDGYDVLACIGTGGMGSVFKVQDKADGRQYAAKVMLIRDEAAVQRFEREIQLTKRLAHPNIVTTYASGFTTDGAPYTLMDYIEGLDLDKIVAAEGPMEMKRAIHIFIQVCDAMQYAHASGLVHRDLKPSNVLVVRSKDGEEVVKIVDFGIAKLAAQVDESAAKLTQTGEVFGSPLFMSPEQCRGEKLDARSDIYSCACAMYETLAGKPPFKGANLLEILNQHMNVLPDRLRKSRTDRHISQSLEAVVFKAMSKEPSSRYASMAALKKDLQRCLKEAAKPGLMSTMWASWTLWRVRTRPLSGRGKILTQLAVWLIIGLAWMGMIATFGNAVWHLADTPQKPVELPKIEFVQSPESLEKTQLQKQARALLDAGKFDQLDELADQLSANHATYCDGATRLEAFYDAFSAEDKVPAHWQTLLTRLRDWIAHKPNSITAHIAIATALVEDAWKQRGPTLKMSETKRKEFSDLLQAAEKDLDAVRNQRSLDPNWYKTMLRIALGLNLKDKNYDQVFDEAVSAYPDYNSFYLQKAIRLLPTWHGKPGEMEQFAIQTAIVRGDKLYAQIVWNQNRLFVNVFKQTKFSWPRARQGLQQLMTEHRNAPDVVQPFAKLAWLADDRTTFAWLAPLIGGKVSQPYWPRRLDYATALQWLNGSTMEADMRAASNQGRYADAERIGFQQLQYHEKIVGKYNGELITDLVSLANSEMNQGEYEQAARTLDRANELAKQAYPPDDRRLLRLVDTNGFLMKVTGNSAKAEFFFSKALAMLDDENSPWSCEIASNLANVLAKEGKFKEAERMGENAAKTIEKLKGANSDELVNILNNLEHVYILEQRFDMAEKICLHELPLFEHQLGPDTYMVAFVLAQLAGIYHVTGKIDQAAAYYKQALSATQKCVGKDNPRYKQLELNYAHLNEPHYVPTNMK